MAFSRSSPVANDKYYSDMTAMENMLAEMRKSNAGAPAPHRARSNTAGDHIEVKSTEGKAQGGKGGRRARTAGRTTKGNLALDSDATEALVKSTLRSA